MKLKKFLAAIVTVIFIFGIATPCLAAKNISALGKVSTQKNIQYISVRTTKTLKNKKFPLKQSRRKCTKFV